MVWKREGAREGSPTWNVGLVIVYGSMEFGYVLQALRLLEEEVWRRSRGLSKPVAASRPGTGD